MQPSSDLISGTFLNLFLIAALRTWNKPLTALFLALFGLGKVELTLGAIALSLLWFMWEQRKGDARPLAGMLFTWMWMGLLILPALVLKGSNPFMESRSTVAFLSANSGFMRFHQFQAGVPSTGEAIKATETIVFAKAHSFPEIILKYPRLYFDYVGISAARSIPNVLAVFKFMAIPGIYVAMHWRQLRCNKFLLFAALCILIPS